MDKIVITKAMKIKLNTKEKSEIKFLWTKGHSGNWGNKIADILADWERTFETPHPITLGSRPLKTLILL